MPEMLDGHEVLTRHEARTLLRLGSEYHNGSLSLPPEIEELKHRIEVETRNAELFMARVGAVDYGMINTVVEMKMQLDGLYAAWAVRETRGVI